MTDSKKNVTTAIPYTHWAYFADRAAAEACAKELDTRFDCLAGIETAIEPTDGRPWLLLASRPVELGTDWHTQIQDVVERHGGFYDGGESGWIDFSTGRAVYLQAGENA